MLERSNLFERHLSGSLNFLGLCIYIYINIYTAQNQSGESNNRRVLVSFVKRKIMDSLFYFWDIWFLKSIYFGSEYETFWDSMCVFSTLKHPVVSERKPLTFFF